MKIEIRIPSVGESVVEAQIGKIFKQSGALVKTDEELLELETEKVNQVVYAPVAGQLTLSVKMGDTVKIGQVIGFVDSSVAVPNHNNHTDKPATPPPAPTPAPAAAAPREPGIGHIGAKEPRLPQHHRHERGDAVARARQETRADLGRRLGNAEVPAFLPRQRSRAARAGVSASGTLRRAMVSRDELRPLCRYARAWRRRHGS